MPRSLLRNAWNRSLPLQRKPRWWTATVLRRLLWRTRFIAITGSNGKSTVTRVLAEVLAVDAPTQWTRINRNGEDGVTETIAFCNPFKTRYAVFEVGAGTPGKVKKLGRLIRPDIAVVLSVFLEHRASLHSLRGVAAEKASLLEELAPEGIAVLNADDGYVAEMAVPEGRKTVRFGGGAANDFSFENVESAWPQLLRFTAVAGGQRQDIRTRLLGTHWAGPILASIAVARQLGLPFERIAESIASVPPYPGRMQVVNLPSGAVAIRDEFKGSTHTIAVALKELEKAEARRKFIVLGDVAESSHSPRKRLERLGKQAAAHADFVVFVGDKAAHGVRGAIKAGLDERHALAFANHQEAAPFLASSLKGGDIVLFKADRNRQLTRLFYSLLGEVRCAVPTCSKTMVCDECPEFKNPGLVRQVNAHLTAPLRCD